ncbi:hypothetical protein BDV23DRAFT_164725 [Aspergillus alliaceus]|uniref:Uncharacterized protein n=1 Tax=Petromyces alliaceus TaxID=209559 RepID=A0A5N7BUS2_PETAA|nr:hypothetical protein BDV23DRAFT_164725 [Aspergillus alliaceus]
MLLQLESFSNVHRTTTLIIALLLCIHYSYYSTTIYREKVPHCQEESLDRAP